MPTDVEEAILRAERRAFWEAGPAAVVDGEKARIDALLSKKAAKWEKILLEICEYDEGGNMRQLDRLATKVLGDYYAVSRQLFHVEAAMLPNQMCMVAVARSFYEKGRGLYQRSSLLPSLEYLMDASVIYRLILEKEKDASARNRLIHWEMPTVIYRGLVHYNLGQFEEAVAAYREACFLGRSSAIDWHGNPLGLSTIDVNFTNENMEIALDGCLESMAKQKMNSSRPHYSRFEVKKLRMELEIQHCHKGRVQCATCGVRLFPSSPVQLFCCDVCERTCYCRTKCQRKDWPDHQAVCGKLIRVPDEYRGRFFQHLQLHSDEPQIYKEASGDRYALLYDTTTSRFFDSLSDWDVYFVPSEAEAANKRASDDISAAITAKAEADKAAKAAKAEAKAARSRARRGSGH